MCGTGRTAPDSFYLVVDRFNLIFYTGRTAPVSFYLTFYISPLKGFVKMYVNDELYNDYEGRTGFGGEFFNKFGIYHSWISRWNDEVHGEYPTQVVYYDNLFRTNSKKKLLKLIKN